MKTVQQVHPVSGITYVYSYEYTKDPETGKRKMERKCIGKLDENGQLVPTGKVGRPTRKPPLQMADVDSLGLSEAERKGYTDQIAALQSELRIVKKENAEQKKLLDSLVKMLAQYQPATAGSTQ